MSRVALAVAAAALALALLPAPSTAQAGQADLAITSFTLLGPTPGWTDGVGNSTSAKVVVANLGTATIPAYEVDFRWDGTAGTSPMNGPGQVAGESSLVVSERPLPPGESHSFTVPWRLKAGQEDQAGPGALRAVAVIGTTTDGEASAATAAERTFDNNARSIPLFLPVHAFDFTIPGGPGEVPAEGTGFFPLRLNNTGNVASRIEFLVVAPPSDSRLEAAVEPRVLEVAAGAQANATLFVDFEPAGDDSPFSVLYTVEAKPAVGKAVRRTTPTLNGTGDEASLAGFSFTAARPEPTLFAPSGATTPVRVLIQNTGSRPDVYTITARLEGGEGWTIGGTRIGLLGQEDGQAVLPLAVPAGTPAGTRALLHLDVAGSLLPEPVPIDLEVVAPGPVLSIGNLTLDTGDAYVGDRPDVLVEVVNDGLAARSGTVLRLSTEVPGAIPQRLEALVDGIPAGGRLVHRFPMETLEAGGIARFRADLVSPEGATSPMVAMSLPVHAPALHVDAPAPMAGGPGEAVAYRVAPNAFRVSNGGDMAERVDLEAFTDAGTVRLEGSPVLVLAPGETRTVAVVQALPSPMGDLSLVGVSLRASIATRPSLSWSAQVETPLQDVDPPTLAVSSPTPAVWSLAHPFPLEILATDGDRVEAVNATITDPAGNRTVVALAQAPDGLWKATAPFGQAGDHGIRFAAKDASGNVAQPLTVAVRAAIVDPPVLRLEGLGDGIIRPGTKLVLVIEDPLGVSSATLEVRQGSSVLRRTLDVVDGNATVDLSGIAAGPAELTFEAVDTAGASALLVAHVEVVEAVTDGGSAEPPREAAGLGTAAAFAALALSGLARAWAGRREDTP